MTAQTENPSVRAHRWAEELASYKDDSVKRHAAVSDFITEMMHDGTEIVARTLSTWFRTYDIRISVIEMRRRVFDEFHRLYADEIRKVCAKEPIQDRFPPYEKVKQDA